MANRNHIPLALVSGLILLLTAAPSIADEFDALRARVRAQLVEENVPSLAVAVAKGGDVLWEEGFGWADRENRRAATEHTLYSLASISKPITATGLMVLVERGQLALDRPANDYLVEARLTANIGAAAESTLRRLANHSAGLPLHYHFFYADEPALRPAMDETIRRYGHLVYVPGETFRYSNLGYGVLDYLIERTSGQTYAEFMRREVFVPLGLTHMSVGVGPGLENQQAIRYASDQTPLPHYEFDHPGGSAVYSSAHDLLRFGMFHVNTRQADQKAILSEASIGDMQRPTAEVGDGVGYGVGWFVNPNDFGVHSVSHSGGMGGVRTRLTLVPAEKIVVVALCNSESGLPQRISQDILAVLLPAYGAALGASRQPPAAGQPTPPAEPAPLNLSELAGEWRGKVSTYQGDRPLTLSFKESGDVHVELADQLKTLLSDTKFENGFLVGRFAGDIGTDDTKSRPYQLHLNLKLRGSTLGGSMTAISLPAPRPGNALSHWVELTRAAP